MEIQGQELSGKIITSFYNVHNNLGFGFLEEVYESALFLELQSMSLFCEKQKPIQVFYNNQIIGNYFADIMVNGSIIIKLKAAEMIVEEDELQLANCLKASKIEMGLLLNFGKSPQFKRKYFTNDRKKINQYTSV